MAIVGKYTEKGGIVTADGTQSFVPGGTGFDAFVAAAVANGDTISPYVAPVIDFNAVDQDTLNTALAAPGSVVRALALVTFAEINKLRVAGGASAYTLAQFTAALKAQMR